MSLSIPPLAFDISSVLFPHLKELHLPQGWGSWGGVHGAGTACGQGSAQAGILYCSGTPGDALLAGRGCCCTSEVVVLCPCRVYEYQQIPPLINRIPVKTRRTHLGAGSKSSLSSQPRTRSRTSSTTGQTKCKCNWVGRKRKLSSCAQCIRAALQPRGPTGC